MKERGKAEREDGKEWGNTEIGACAKVVPEHATVTTVRLETYYSDYGAIGSTLQ